MKNKKIVLIFALLLCVGAIATFIISKNKAVEYSLEVIEVAPNEYGYQILKAERTVIYQPFVPAVGGRQPFVAEEDARKVGALVLKRMSSNESFTISEEDLKELNIQYAE